MLVLWHCYCKLWYCNIGVLMLLWCHCDMIILALWSCCCDTTVATLLLWRGYNVVMLRCRCCRHAAVVTLLLWFKMYLMPLLWRHDALKGWSDVVMREKKRWDRQLDVVWLRLYHKTVNFPYELWTEQVVLLSCDCD